MASDGAEGTNPQTCEPQTSKIRALERQVAALTARCEEAERTTAAKSMFLATMSHELRTPLNGIVVAAELLDADTLPPPQRRLVRTIRASSEALQTIISDILDFSKIEAGHLALDPVDMSLSQLVEDTAEMLAMRAADKGLALVTVIDPHSPDHMLGDSARLRQVLLNLAGNAVKFTQFGHVVIRAGVEAVTQDIASVLLEVEDTGIGIAPDRQAAIFAPFVQAEGATERQFGGTGLGLTIARAIVEAMGGSIGVDSEEASGTRFWVRVPLQVRPERRQMPDVAGLRVMLTYCPDSAETDCLHDYLTAAGADVHYYGMEEAGEGDIIIVDAESPVMPDLVEQGLAVVTLSPLALRKDPVGRWAVPRPIKRLDLLRMTATAAGRLAPMPVPTRRSCDMLVTVSGRRILLADDHPTNQAVLRLMLELAGHAVDVASDGEQAWALLQDGTYDLLLTDCQMPNLDGYGLSRRIRAAEDGTNVHLPIIALTADARADSAAACRDSGMDQWLSKPASRATLQHALDSAFAKTGPAPESPCSVERPRENTLNVLDESVLLNDVLGGDRSMLGPLLEEFIAATQDDIRSLAAAWQAGNHEQARRSAHAAKGAARQAGATQLATTCQAFETALRAGNMAQAAALAEAVGTTFADVATVVAALSCQDVAGNRS